MLASLASKSSLADLARRSSTRRINVAGTAIDLPRRVFQERLQGVASFLPKDGSTAAPETEFKLAGLAVEADRAYRRKSSEASALRVVGTAMYPSVSTRWFPPSSAFAPRRSAKSKLESASPLEHFVRIPVR